MKAARAGGRGPSSGRPRRGRRRAPPPRRPGAGHRAGAFARGARLEHPPAGGPGHR
jgi:hypothetical protein